MKKTLFICVLTLLNVSLFAQEKAALTKEETVNYLSKKVSEVFNLRTTFTDGVTLYLISTSFSLSNSNVQIYTKRSNHLETPSYDKCSYFYQEAYQTFNPAHIVEIIDSDNFKGEVGEIKIKLLSNTGNVRFEEANLKDRYIGYYKECGCCQFYKNPTKVETTQFIYLRYLKSDPTNFNKFKKALEHLRDLCKAEDDPFGE